MKHSPEEILKALHVIKDECLYVGQTCEGCPFASYEDDCLIVERNPEAWSINDNSVSTWKGLL